MFFIYNSFYTKKKLPLVLMVPLFEIVELLLDIKIVVWLVEVVDKLFEIANDVVIAVFVVVGIT